MELLKSRRFWVMLLDTTVSILIHYFGGGDTKFLIGALQPVAMLLIASYTSEQFAPVK